MPLITITLDYDCLTQPQAIIKGCELILASPDKDKPIFEVGNDEIMVVVEVEK